jgi:integrase
MKNWQLHREELLTDEEWNKFKLYLEERVKNGNWTDYQDRAICYFAVWTGLRRSEIADIKLSDLNLGYRPYIIVRNGKGSKYREVLISQECSLFIKYFLKTRHNNGEHLFIPQRGMKYTGDGIYRVWKTALKDAGLPHRSIHKARHYNGSKLYQITKDPKFVQEQLGHSRITTTEVYMHVFDDEAQKHLQNFDNSLKM